MNLADLQEIEAYRRFKLLGTTIEEGDSAKLRMRAHQVGLPVAVLRQWHALYLHGGMTALRPHWEPLPEAIWALIQQRYAALGELADAETLSQEALCRLAARQGWTMQQTSRWLGRYRIGGIMGLAPLKRPVRPRIVPDLGALSPSQRDEVFRRHALLGALAEQEHVSNALLQERAEAVDVSLRTLRDYHTRFRHEGLAGLAPRRRTDTGTPHLLSTEMVQVIEGLRLTHRDSSVRFIHELACQHAAARGERAPGLWQVRSICTQIPAPVRLLADGREEEFRNRYRLTYPIVHDPHHVVWQIDHKAPLHVLIRDLRVPSHRTKSGEVRPYLTLVIDSASRLVMAGLFSYDPPDRFQVAAAIRAGILTTQDKPFGGVPDEIWVDNGKDLIAEHVLQLAAGLGSTLLPGPPHYPELRGIVERFHETLDTRLWSTLPGYVGANVVERNPQAKAELSLSELDQRFRAFIERYHQEVHSVTGQTPIQFWQEHATQIPVNERLLDVLLKEAAQRRVLKEGIKYMSRVYWHADLATLVGEDVLVRAVPSYMAPDELEVYFEDQWRCTAFALDSARGQALPRAVVSDAQRQQRQTARRRITKAREVVQAIEKEAPSVSSEQRRPRRRTAPSPEFPIAPVPTTRPPDLFDFLVAERTRKDPSHDS
ncbi:MAG: Mu transposase C-terminal domain-containing protein [Chloroflexota bacterium]|nr:Mu transposase C-terminal domain-containing protein [Chloroflexota bacterium]